MQGLVNGIVRGFLRISGLGTYVDMAKEHPVYAGLLLLALVLTLVWMVRLTPKFSAGVGKTIGGIAIGFLILGIGIGIAIGIANMIVHMGLGMITGAIGSIPLIGPPLAKIAHYIISALATIIIMIGIGMYFLKNIGSLMDKFLGVITGASKDWKADGDGGHLGVKWSYVIMGNLVFAGMICHPGLNAKWYYIPAILSGIAGIVSIFVTTKRGQKVMDKAKGKVTGGLLADGSHHCGNKGMMPLEDKKAWARGKRKPLLDDEGNPRFKYVANCGHLIQKGEDRCGGGQCDNWSYFLDWTCECSAGQKKRPTLSWDTKKCPKCARQKPQRPWCCPKCRYNGKKDQGIPWKIPTCPKCHTARPPRPTTPFHYSWDDVHQSAPEPMTPKAKAKGKKATEGTAPKPAPKAAAGKWQCKALVDLRTEKGFVPQRKPDGSLVLGTDSKPLRKKGPCGHMNPSSAHQCEACGASKSGSRASSVSGGVVSCPHCGGSVSASASFCRHCRTRLGSHSQAVPSAPTPASRPGSHRTAVAAPPPRPRRKRRRGGVQPFTIDDMFRH